MFKSIDTDGSESLSLSEVILFLKVAEKTKQKLQNSCLSQNVVHKSKYFPQSICADISEDNVEKIFSNFDSTGDKIVDYEEFKVSAQAIFHPAMYL